MDPRFDDLAGRYREETFKKRYSFLYDEQLPEEKAQLKKQMKVSCRSAHIIAIERSIPSGQQT